MRSRCYARCGIGHESFGFLSSLSFMSPRLALSAGIRTLIIRCDLLSDVRG